MPQRSFVLPDFPEVVFYCFEEYLYIGQVMGLLSDLGKRSSDMGLPEKLSRVYGVHRRLEEEEAVRAHLTAQNVDGLRIYAGLSANWTNGTTQQRGCRGVGTYNCGSLGSSLRIENYDRNYHKFHWFAAEDL